MNSIKTLPILIFVFMLPACSSTIDYSTDLQPGNDFTALEKFSWHNVTALQAPGNKYVTDKSVDTQIRENINHLLQSKNFDFVSNPQEADFLVTYSIVTDDIMDIQSYRKTHGYATGWGFDGDYHVASGYRGYPYRNTQDTFVLDIVSASDNKLLWRGIAEGRISGEKLTPEAQNQLFTEVVVNVLNNFPVGK